LRRFPAGARSSTLPLSQAVAKSVRGYDEKDAVRSLSIAIDAKAWIFPVQTPRPQLGEGRFDVVHLKEASVLSRIASIFGETDPDAVSAEQHQRLQIRGPRGAG